MFKSLIVLMAFISLTTYAQDPENIKDGLNLSLKASGQSVKTKSKLQNRLWLLRSNY